VSDMQRFCLDSNVFIQAKNGPYGFDIVPAFWEFLDKKAEEGIIFTSTFVYDELKKGSDELAKWAVDRRRSKFFVDANEECQRVFGSIANYVNSEYEPYNSNHFLSVADPWIIALSKCSNAVVVTHEVLVAPNSAKIKIPNICKQFDVKFTDPYKMLRKLKAQFTCNI
jgi:hypothetical protein